MEIKGLSITLADLKIEAERRKYRKLDYYFPDEGPLRRELYAKHMEFIEATSKYREVCFCAANRAGKTETAAYAAAIWLTGEYPHWWHGKRFNKPVNVLVAGETGKLVRDSIQMKLLGAPNAIGEGIIPRDNIVSITRKSGVPDAIDTVSVKHKGGGFSTLQFQSYDQGREAFQATERDVVLMDEEPDLSIHNECLIRTMTTNGLVLLAFTPLKGMSETVLSFQNKDREGIAKIVRASWDDAPHLSAESKAAMMAALPPYQRDARSKGIPQLGSGAVFPIPETELLVEPFAVPAHYRKAYGMDVGWNYTAACWLAHDSENDIIYIIGDYKRSDAEPTTHVASINARGRLPGLIDPASQGRGQDDGRKLIDQYRQLGLDLTIADNAVEAGLFDIYTRMTTGRLKIFKTCLYLIEELRLYRRDEKGRIVKQNDHVIDAMRYVCRSGLPLAVAAEIKGAAPDVDPYAKARGRVGWMAS